MWAGEDLRSIRSTIGIVVIICRAPPTNHIPWCHHGKTNPDTWTKVEGVTVNVLHPGDVKTNIATNSPGGLFFGFLLALGGKDKTTSSSRSEEAWGQEQPRHRPRRGDEDSTPAAQAWLDDEGGPAPRKASWKQAASSQASAEQGAQTSIYLAVDEKVARETGHYFSDCRRSWISRQAADRSRCERFFWESARLVHLDDAKVKALLEQQ
ncbi:hypothetical protein HPB50_026150 [Hyalomma asiaticum]|uniref:Uncharacterized protein n=1 Tax=Hyalomma asiaticum TaxID=266040 RepID=A0ACB7T238_HYAAI|nr:hypothetical protein HPB50_026150 [Hyalomma asiaticum]